MRALFVTGTGTEIGKTFVTAGLISHLRRLGRTVEALKPVASGFDRASIETSDAAVLLNALGRPATSENIESLSPWRFRAPLSPDLAAKREGRTLDFEALVEFSRRRLTETSAAFLIEGVGGVMVPLDHEHTVLDWIAQMDMPVLVVAGSYLGTISHTLTALHVLRDRELQVAALVVSESAHSSVTLADTVAVIGRFTPNIRVIGLPRLPPCSANHPAFGEIVRVLDGDS